MKYVMHYLASLLIASSLLSTVAHASVCSGSQTYVYDSQGHLIAVYMTCSGDCDGSGECTLFTAGDFSWCQCDSGGTLPPCVTVSVSNGSAPPGTRCADITCGGVCTLTTIQWTDEFGKLHVQYKCTCFI